MFYTEVTESFCILACFSENTPRTAMRRDSPLYAHYGRFQHSCAPFRRFRLVSGVSACLALTRTLAVYFLFSGSHSFIFLPPFAPPALPGFNATMTALTSIRTALCRRYSGQFSLLHSLVLHGILPPNTPLRPVPAFSHDVSRTGFPASSRLLRRGRYAGFQASSLVRRLAASIRPNRVRILRTAISHPLALHPTSR